MEFFRSLVEKCQIRTLPAGFRLVPGVFTGYSFFKLSSPARPRRDLQVPILNLGQAGNEFLSQRDVIDVDLQDPNRVGQPKSDSKVVFDHRRRGPGWIELGP